jgi:hypothetical protein
MKKYPLMQKRRAIISTSLKNEIFTSAKKSGNPAVTAIAKIPLNALFGSFCGCLKVCVISGFGPHRSGGCGFAGEESSMTGFTDANSTFNGVESPNDAMTNVNLRESAYNN